MGKEFDSRSIGVIAENKEKYISFNISVIVDRYENMWGRIKEKKIQLRFINSLWLVAWTHLLGTWFGVNRMMCNKCGSQYAHANYARCQGDSHHKPMIDLIFDNLRVSDMDEQFRLFLRKGVYPNEHRGNWKSSKRTISP